MLVVIIIIIFRVFFVIFFLTQIIRASTQHALKVNICHQQHTHTSSWQELALHITNQRTHSDHPRLLLIPDPFISLQLFLLLGSLLLLLKRLWLSTLVINYSLIWTITVYFHLAICHLSSKFWPFVCIIISACSFKCFCC